jgi:hypothetical protein
MEPMAALAAAFSRHLGSVDRSSSTSAIASKMRFRPVERRAVHRCPDTIFEVRHFHHQLTPALAADAYLLPIPLARDLFLARPVESSFKFSDADKLGPSSSKNLRRSVESEKARKHLSTS